eukprot:2615744-Rhodomonas_salina.1
MYLAKPPPFFSFPPAGLRSKLGIDHRLGPPYPISVRDIACAHGPITLSQYRTCARWQTAPYDMSLSDMA